MRTVTAPLVVRRLGSARLVFTALLLIMITVATLAAALAELAGQALAQAAVRKLVGAAGTSLTIDGPLGEEAARADTAVIRSALRATLGAVPVTLYRLAWSQSLGLPATRGSAQVPLLAAAAPDAISAKAALIRGTWPGSPSAGHPVPAAIPSAVADRLRLAVGDVLTVHDRNRGTVVRMRIVGIYRPRKPGEAYWNLDLIGTAGVNSVGAFVTYGPAVVDQAAFSRGYLPVNYSSWLALPQTARIRTGQLRALAARVSRLESALRQSPRLGGLQVITKLPDVLNGIATNLTVARALLAIGALQLLLVAGATVLLATSLLAGQRGGESALFRARGGSRWQLARLNAAEVLPAACIAAIGGALLGSRLAALMSETGPLHNVQLRLSGTPASVWWAATAAALVCAVPPLALALHRLAPGAERVRRGRQAAVAGIVRASGDLALAALAALAVWQLHRYVPGGRAIGGGIGPVRPDRRASSAAFTRGSGVSAVSRAYSAGSTPNAGMSVNRSPGGDDGRLARCEQIGGGLLRPAGDPVLDPGHGVLWPCWHGLNAGIGNQALDHACGPADIGPGEVDFAGDTPRPVLGPPQVSGLPITGWANRRHHRLSRAAVEQVVPPGQMHARALADLGWDRVRQRDGPRLTGRGHQADVLSAVTVPQAKPALAGRAGPGSQQLGQDQRIGRVQAALPRPLARPRGLTLRAGRRQGNRMELHAGMQRHPAPRRNRGPADQATTCVRIFGRMQHSRVGLEAARYHRGHGVGVKRRQPPADPSGLPGIRAPHGLSRTLHRDIIPAPPHPARQPRASTAPSPAIMGNASQYQGSVARPQDPGRHS